MDEFILFARPQEQFVIVGHEPEVAFYVWVEPEIVSTTYNVH